MVALLINTGFEPVYFRLKALVLASCVLGVDDTPLKVLDRDHPAGIRRGHLWVYVGYEGIIPRRVVYHFTSTWEKEGPLTFLKNRTGYIQGDGYAGYEGLIGSNPAQADRVGCWTHVCRKYKDALERSGGPSGTYGRQNPFHYIRDVLDRLSCGWPHSRLDKLHPEHWEPSKAHPQSYAELTAIEPQELDGEVHPAGVCMPLDAQY